MILSPLPIQKFFGNDGNPLNGGLLFTYVAGTTTKVATYKDSTGGPVNTNPIVLDYRGEANVWLDPLLVYKFVLSPPNDTDPPTNPIWSVDNVAGGLTVSALTQQFLGQIIYPRTPAEINAAVFPTAYIYIPGDVRRYGAACNNIADDTAAINVAATIARSAYPTYQAWVIFNGPGPCKVSGSLNFSLCDVWGYGETEHIKATSAQFDVMTSTGSTRLINLRVNGGWDGVTAGLTGDILSCVNAPAHPYDIDLLNCVFTFAKKRFVYIDRGGYSSFHAVRCLSAGGDGIELHGTDLATNAMTTVGFTGKCQFSSCPNGYNMRISYGVCINVTDAILESGKGIFIGGSNRALRFHSVYQENTSPALFFDWSTSDGIGIDVRGCFGGNTSIAYNGSWQDVYFGGNSNLAEPAIPFPSRIVTADSGQITTATHGGLSVTVTSASLAPGTWIITGTLQTADAGAANLQDASFVLTTDVTNNGTASGTAGTFEVGTARVYAVPAGSAARLSGATIYQNTTAASVTYYMRGFFNNSAGTLAYRGEINAVKFQ